MSILLETGFTPPEDVEAKTAALRSAIERWISIHVERVEALGPVRGIICSVGGRRVDGHESFDCDFVSDSGSVHVITVSACSANDLDDLDAQVVDAVSAMTLIGMLLERLGIRPKLSAR